MRKSEIVLVLSMLILIVSCEGINEYDYLQVVIQWLPATCSDYNKPAGCYVIPSDMFGIHGLWPSLYNGRPQCSGSPFDITQVSSLQPGISEIWPNVQTGDNVWLWGHEWDKHGTCTESTLFNQEEYFSFAMDTYIENNVLNILKNNQITPNGQVYTRDQIYAPIKARTGKKPAVRCNSNWSTGSQQLHEITICYNRDATAFEDCPDNANTCNTNFVWNSWANSVKAAVSNE